MCDASPRCEHTAGAVKGKNARRSNHSTEVSKSDKEKPKKLFKTLDSVFNT